MQIISDEYKRLNEELHGQNRFYGAIGFRHTDKILELAKKYQIESGENILDYGCGKSSLARNLWFDIREYDPAIKKFSNTPSQADLIVCTDVLEHIEPEYIDNVLKHIFNLMNKAGFFTIALDKARKNLPDGRNAHLLVKPPIWWFEKLDQYFEIMELKREQFEMHLVVEPKKD